MLIDGCPPVLVRLYVWLRAEGCEIMVGLEELNPKGAAVVGVVWYDGRVAIVKLIILLLDQRKQRDNR